MLDHQPRGLLRWLLRLPIGLYGGGLGWLLGERFLLLHHRGRRTGHPRRTVLEVVEADRQAGRYLVAAAWGERADWLLNIRTDPHVEIEVGRRRLPAHAEELTTEHGLAALERYQRQHRLAARALGPLLGYDLRQPVQRRRMAKDIPLVALTASKANRPLEE